MSKPTNHADQLNLKLPQIFLDKILLAAFFASAIAAILLTLRSASLMNILIDYTAAASFLLLYIFRNKTAASLKIATLILFCSLLIVYSFLSSGFMKNGIILFAIITVFAFSYLPSKVAAIVPVIGLSFMLLVAILSSLGYISYDPSMIEELGHWSTWAISLTATLLFVLIAAGSISSFKQQLRQKIYHLEKSKKDLEYLVYFDQLTGLMNRKQFEQNVNTRMALIKDQNRNGILILMDIKGFRIFNSLYGHRLGDRLLKKMGNLLSGYQKEGNSIARLSGDEFAGWIENYDGETVSKYIQQFFQDLAEAPDFFQDISFYSAFAYAEEDDSTFSHLISKAGLAMRIAKQNDVLTPVEFNNDMRNMIHEEEIVTNLVKTAVATDLFSVVYQKKVDILTKKTVGVEALARLNISGQAITPNQFIPVVQKTNLMAEFTRLIFRQVLEDFSKLQKKFTANISVSINISPLFFLSSEFIPFVQHDLHAYNVDPQNLILEITEDLYIADTELANHAAAELRAMGIRLSLDDFGKGYSSLSYLQNMNIDEVKIDRSFLSNIEEDPRSFKVFKAICSIAKSLGYVVVAEGVETESQLAIIQKTSCNLIQGFLFSKPAKIDEL